MGPKGVGENSQLSPEFMATANNTAKILDADLRSLYLAPSWAHRHLRNESFIG
ncbi:unnamed protein product [Acidithrix sp. C25]|nr:unnamed protein product [Acidithrix sp. C25]